MAGGKLLKTGLRCLQAGNHCVLLFAQMTKMLNIIEDYMNYRKYKYVRLDGSSTITDCQATKVTIYRLICKETVEEKILHRASQKSTVRHLVMTGGHIHGDLLAPEDVLSLLFDDPQTEQKLKEIPAQVKDRQKRKGGTKAIRIDEEGDARFEDIMDPEPTADADTTSPSEKPMSSKKRKATDRGTSKPRPQKGSKNLNTSASDAMVPGSELDDRKPQRTKRPTKSLNENLEPAFTATAVAEDQNRFLYHIHLKNSSFQFLTQSDLSAGFNSIGWRTIIRKSGDVLAVWRKFYDSLV